LAQIPPPIGEPSLVVIARVRNEAIHLREFPQHYFDEGAERIIIIDNNSEPPVHFAHSNITVIRGRLKRGDDKRRTEMKDVEAAMHRCGKLGYTWAANVDADEYMTTRKHTNRTLIQELQISFADVDAIGIPWLFMMSDFAREPASVLVDIRRRWDMDRHHHTGGPRKYRDRFWFVEYKHIERLRRFESLPRPHQVKMEAGAVIVDGVEKRREGGSLSAVAYRRLSEAKIANALLLTYHFRFSSFEAIAHKCNATSALQTYNRQDTSYCMKRAKEFVRPELEDAVLANKTAERRRVRMRRGKELG